ncbi:MAG: LysR family transcriptional regulator [Phreatobacter sp.]|uniref:LysR family transcriptional regulator n=1 Tax=Phreatobacter sp. TaxID=1966341 RepID=UPI001A5EE4FD|nr:LysR family transcriptional regulator [Phreatobacter sp.]MBL8571274.1 LysR family transcriptional regulator [Phreatobacter sp.]
MDARTLRYFTAVADDGSFSRASERLGIAQPALSLQVRKLEAELGVELLWRTGRGVVPTAAGAKLLTHAREILRRLDVAREDLRGEAAQPIGRVAIGLAQSLAVALTVPIVKEVVRAWPRVSLLINQGSTGYIPGWLRSGHLDLGFMFQADTGQGLHYQPLVDEELFFVGPAQSLPIEAGHGATTGAFPFADLKHYPLILPARMHSLRELIDGYARRSGVNLHVIAEVDAVPQLKDLAMAGIGHTILSYSSVRDELASGRLSGARIVEPLVERSVFLCRLASVPPSNAVRAVEDLVRRTVTSLVSEGHWPARISQRPSFEK